MAEKDTKRLSRLLAILTKLQTKKTYTAAELSKKFSISVRTIYRDLKALEHAGVPIFNQDGKGIGIMDGYRIPPVMFSEDEANALITAEQIIIHNRDASFVNAYSSAISKIKAVLNPQTQGKVNFLSERLVIRDNSDIQKTSNYLSIIQVSITNYKVVQLNYLSAEGAEYTRRMVEPFALYSTQNNWILIANCRLRKAYRSFRLDRIADLKILEENFEPHKITFEEYFRSCQEKYFLNL